MDERSKVDKYLCTVCGHRHSNGWYCKHSIDAKDATIAALRAEVERLKEQLETARMLKHDACRLCDEARTELQTLKSELSQLREDRRVLAEEALALRERLAAVEESNGDYRGTTEAQRCEARIEAAVCRQQAAMKATDASGALGRAQ